MFELIQGPTNRKVGWVQTLDSRGQSLNGFTSLSQAQGATHSREVKGCLMFHYNILLYYNFDIYVNMPIYCTFSRQAEDIEAYFK